MVTVVAIVFELSIQQTNVVTILNFQLENYILLLGIANEMASIFL